MLKINGVAIATPSKFSVDLTDLDGESTRMANGILTRDRIAVKRKLNCEWPSLSNIEISALLKAVKDEFFTVEYPDPMEGSMQTKTFYVGDRNAPMYNYNNGSPRWESLKMNLIEQ